MKLQGEHINLRALEPTDIESILKWENDPETWTISNTVAPFSRFVLEEYIVSSHQDIYAAKQLRLIIEKEGKAIGSIDLFDFEPKHQRAGIGILIAEKEDRRKGYASDALKVLIEYCFTTLNLHQIYCNILTDNEASISLFQQHGFQVVGTKTQWVREGNVFKDEMLLQKIR